MARPAKATALKVLQGTDRKDRKRDEIEPPAAPDPVAAKPPTWLKGEGRKQWKKMYQVLFDLGLLSEIDLDSFAHYCQLHGNLITNFYKVGVPAPPAYLAQYRLYSGMFGLDPTSRVKIPNTKPKTKKKNKFSEL